MDDKRKKYNYTGENHFQDHFDGIPDNPPIKVSPNCTSFHHQTGLLRLL